MKILAGIVLLTSAPMAKFMNKNVPGIFVPAGAHRRIGRCTERQGSGDGDQYRGAHDQNHPEREDRRRSPHNGYREGGGGSPYSGAGRKLRISTISPERTS